jgi:hypothetical protein
LDPSLREIITKKLGNHFKHFLAGSRDKSDMPLYLLLAGAGMGKSRNATEFHKTLIECSPVNSDLRRRLNDAAVFHISFEDDTSLRQLERSDLLAAIGNHMLLQLLGGTLNNVLTHYEPPYPVTVFELVAKGKNIKLPDLAGILIIDGIQNFTSHASDGKDQ